MVAVKIADVNANSTNAARNAIGPITSTCTIRCPHDNARSRKLSNRNNTPAAGVAGTMRRATAYPSTVNSPAMMKNAVVTRVMSRDSTAVPNRSPVLFPVKNW